MTAPRWLAVALAALPAFACAAAGPNYSRPTITPPPAYRSVLPPDQAATLADVKWVDQYWDPELTALVEQAIAENLDLRLAVARISEFRARAAGARADLGPTLTGSVDVQPLTRSSDDQSWLRSLYSLGLAFNWEVDFFGRLRRASEAAQNDLLATEEGARAVMSSIVSEVARSWFQIRILDELIGITERNIRLQEDALQLVRRRVQGGVAAGVDEQQAVSQLAGTRAQLPTLQQELALVEDRLSVLLGKPPGAITRPSVPMTAAPPEIPPGLPSQLLERRPDIRQAERELMAATSRIGVATANAFPFPRIGLTAFFGLMSGSLDAIFNGNDSGVFSWGPFVQYPLIDSGRGRAGVGVATAQAEQAAVTYRQTILQAFSEVADSLITIRRARERIEQRQTQVTAASESLRLSNLRYVGGVTDYLEVLDAQRVLFIAETDLARSREDQLLASVQLYRALGGGWSDDELRRLMELPPDARN